MANRGKHRRPTSRLELGIAGACLIGFLVAVGLLGFLPSWDVKTPASIFGGFLVAIGAVLHGFAAADDLEAEDKDMISLWGHTSVIVGGFALAFSAMY